MTCIRNSRTFPEVTGFTRMICKTAHETRHLVLIGAVFPFHLLTKTARLCFLYHSFPLFSLIPKSTFSPYYSYYKGKSCLLNYMNCWCTFSLSLKFYFWCHILQPLWWQDWILVCAFARPLYTDIRSSPCKFSFL